MKHFVSDTHFGHANVLNYSNRPFTSVQEMNEAMILPWNKHVAPNDEVYHLGDFAFMGIEPFRHLLGRLNGKIHVVLGNHDDVIRKNATSLIADGLLSSVQYYKELRHEGHHFMLFHFAGRTWNKAQYDSIHLFGHTHGYLAPRGKSVDVGVDDKNITTEYRPVSIDEVIAFMADRPRHTNHHDGADALATLDRVWDSLSAEAKQEVIDLTNRLTMK